MAAWRASSRRTFDLPFTLSSKNFTCTTVPNGVASASSSASVVHLCRRQRAGDRRAREEAARTRSSQTRRRLWETWQALEMLRVRLAAAASGHRTARSQPTARRVPGAPV